ncbi:methyltransferase [Yersinia phage vB_YenM_P778]
MTTTTVAKLTVGKVKFQGKDTEVLRFALKNVWFYFLTTAPRPNKGKKFNASFPAKDSSYSVQVLVSDKKVLKEITKSKTNPNGYTKVTSHTVEKEDFEEQFKCAPPFEAEEYTLLKLSRHASFQDGATFDGSHAIKLQTLSDGKLVPHDRDIVKAKRHADHEDKKSYDALTTTTMIGNGTSGHVFLTGSWYEFEKEVNQKPIQEQFIITDLVEYVGGTSREAELSEEDLAALGLEGVEVVKSKPRALRELDEAGESGSTGSDDDALEDPEDDDAKAGEEFETD